VILKQLIAQAPDASTCINDNQIATFSADFNTCRIPAVF
jgi:hypothetical protein